MADNPNDDSPEQQPDDLTYESISELKPPRIDTSTKTDNGDEPITERGSTLKQRMQFSPKQTDMQIVDSRLFPTLMEESQEMIKWLNSIMVSRTFPDTYIAKRNILIKHMIREHYPNVSFPEALFVAETALSISLDGEGRLDIIHSFSNLNMGSEEKENRSAT